MADHARHGFPESPLRAMCKVLRSYENRTTFFINRFSDQSKSLCECRLSSGVKVKAPARRASRASGLSDIGARVYPPSTLLYLQRTKILYLASWVAKTSRRCAKTDFLSVK